MLGYVGEWREVRKRRRERRGEGGTVESVTKRKGRPIGVACPYF